jgi:hypothetical protein
VEHHGLPIVLSESNTFWNRVPWTHVRPGDLVATFAHEPFLHVASKQVHQARKTFTFAVVLRVNSHSEFNKAANVTVLSPWTMERVQIQVHNSFRCKRH